MRGAKLLLSSWRVLVVAGFSIGTPPVAQARSGLGLHMPSVTNVARPPPSGKRRFEISLYFEWGRPVRSYRSPKFSVRFGVTCQSSCTHGINSHARSWGSNRSDEATQKFGIPNI